MSDLEKPSGCALEPWRPGTSVWLAVGVGAALWATVVAGAWWAFLRP